MHSAAHNKEVLKTLTEVLFLNVVFLTQLYSDVCFSVCTTSKKELILKSVETYCKKKKKICVQQIYNIFLSSQNERCASSTNTAVQLTKKHARIFIFLSRLFTEVLRTQCTVLCSTRMLHRKRSDSAAIFFCFFFKNPALVRLKKKKKTNVLITCLSKALMDHSLFLTVNCAC